MTRLGQSRLHGRRKPRLLLHNSNILNSTIQTFPQWCRNRAQPPPLSVSCAAFPCRRKSENPKGGGGRPPLPKRLSTDLPTGIKAEPQEAFEGKRRSPAANRAQRDFGFPAFGVFRAERGGPGDSSPGVNGAPMLPAALHKISGPPMPPACRPMGCKSRVIEFQMRHAWQSHPFANLNQFKYS